MWLDLLKDITSKSSALIHKKPKKLPSSYMLILCSMHTNCQLQDALLKNLVALKVLVWSRGRLVTPQILTSFCISLAWWRRLTALQANVSPFLT